MTARRWSGGLICGRRLRFASALALAALAAAATVAPSGLMTYAGQSALPGAVTLTPGASAVYAALSALAGSAVLSPPGSMTYAGAAPLDVTAALALHRQHPALPDCLDQALADVGFVDIVGPADFRLCGRHLSLSLATGPGARSVETA